MENELTKNKWRYEIIGKDGVQYKKNDLLVFSPEYFYPLFMQAKYSDNERTIKNAAYIVKACNAHEELVKALKDVLLIEKHMDSLLGQGLVDYPERKAIRAITKKVSDALQKVNEKE